MNMQKAVKTFLSLLPILLLAGSSHALNEKQFVVDYDISYRIQSNGETIVEHNVTLTNLKNEVVPTNYSFSVKEIKILEISAESNGKKVNVDLSNDQGESGFTVPITNQSIGKDKQNKIKIIYKTNNIASKAGNVWNVFIPKIQVPDSTEIYNVKVYVPTDFGPKMYFSPTPVAEKTEGGNTIYYLTKETFKGTGISAAFGQSQMINFKIKYQLENKNIFPKGFKIPLPPDITNYQQVVYLSINPKPVKITLDADGNSMAYYSLGPRKKLEVELTGSAKVATPQVDPDYGENFQAIPKEIVSRYTGEEKYWNTRTKKIVEVANSLKNNNLNVVKNAQLAYRYVTENLTYDFDASKKNAVERQGSEIALTQKGSWTCMEFTDLFIALTRAMGIPSREMDGYAFNSSENNKPLSLNLKTGDLLHAWAEFYDPYYGWVQVDPTWGTTSGIDYFTKLDTNHLTLSIRGIDSEKPQPAGSYKFQEGKKLIEVDYGQKEIPEVFVPKIKIKKTLNFNIFQLIKGNDRYEVLNESGVFLYIAGDKTLLPYQKTIMYLPKDASSVEFETTDKVKHSFNLF